MMKIICVIYFILQRIPNEFEGLKGKDRYRNFWNEDQKFDFPRIIETKQQENKNDIMKRITDGKNNFENLTNFSFGVQPKKSELRYVVQDKMWTQIMFQLIFT